MKRAGLYGMIAIISNQFLLEILQSIRNDDIRVMVETTRQVLGVDTEDGIRALAGEDEKQTTSVVDSYIDELLKGKIWLDPEVFF